jgi:predicted kinase
VQKEQKIVVVDGILQGGGEEQVLASLWNVVPLLTHAGFSIVSDESPWRERERERESAVCSEVWLLFVKLIKMVR